MNDPIQRYFWLLEIYQCATDFVICTFGFRCCEYCRYILQDENDFTT